MFGRNKKQKEFTDHLFDNIQYAKKNGKKTCSIWVAGILKEDLEYGQKMLRKKGYLYERDATKNWLIVKW